MNHITAALHQTLYAAEPHLHLFIDGQPLDEILHRYYPADDFMLGLVPTLLSWLDYPPHRAVVWERAALGNHDSVMLPVLMCPDDLDLSCRVIVAEVREQDDVVHWPRLGYDVTRSLNPADIGGEVEWLPLIPPVLFARADYKRCLAAFANALSESA